MKNKNEKSYSVLYSRDDDQPQEPVDRAGTYGMETVKFNFAAIDGSLRDTDADEETALADKPKDSLPQKADSENTAEKAAEDSDKTADSKASDNAESDSEDSKPSAPDKAEDTACEDGKSLPDSEKEPEPSDTKTRAAKAQTGRVYRSGFDIFLSNPVFSLIMLGVIIVMCVGIAVFCPSAVKLESSSMIIARRNAADDLRSGMDLVSTNIVNKVFDLPEVFLLPTTDSPGTKPMPSGYSTYTDADGIKHSVYEDLTIKVDVWKVKKKLNGRSYVASYAHVKIVHPTQLRTSVSKTGYLNRSKTTKQAGKMNAIVAVNGDFYTLRNGGIIIKQGTQYCYRPSGKETLFIDSEGNFTIMSSTEALNSGFMDNNTIYNTLYFGPPLVKDGELCSYKYTEKTKNTLPAMLFGRNPRTGIGQIGELEYMLIVVDGRTYDSAGLSVNNFAKLFYEQGCVNAYNLDGGQSSNLYFKNKIYNTISDGGERLISDIVYFASALPEDSEARNR